MRSFLLIGVMLMTLGLLQNGWSQGIDFFEGDWEETLELAREKEKLIFVDCFAEWCGPCKRMAAQVFPDPEVGEFFNEHFINLKWDMEKGKGLEFRQKYPVSAFPTLYFIDPEGEVVVSVSGARDAAGLIRLGEKALASYNPYADYSILYEEGDRSSETIFHHYNNLRREGQNIRPLANDYFRAQADMSDEYNLRLLSVAVEEADSRLFDLLIENREGVIEAIGEEEFNEIVMDAGWNTVSKAMNLREPFLVEEAINKIKFADNPNARSFELRAPIYYAIQTRNEDQYRENMGPFIRELGDQENDRAVELFDLGMRFFSDNSGFVDFLEGEWRRLARSSENPEIIFRHARLQLKLDNQRQALRSVERAIEKLDEDDERLGLYEEFRQKIN